MGHHHQAVDEERDRGQAAEAQRAAEETDGASQDPLQGAFVPGNPGRRSMR